MLPLVIRSTDEMLRLVPREPCKPRSRCGATKTGTIMSVVLPSASSGIITGVMLAFARARGRNSAGLLTCARQLTCSIELNPSKRMSSLSLQIFGNALTGYGQPCLKLRIRVGGEHSLSLARVLLFTVAARWIASRTTSRWFGRVTEPRCMWTGQCSPGLKANDTTRRSRDTGHQRDNGWRGDREYPAHSRRRRGRDRPVTDSVHRLRRGAKRLEARDLNVYYGSFKAVADLNMTVNPRSVTALIGPSGCSKSTVLRSPQPSA